MSTTSIAAKSNLSTEERKPCSSADTFLFNRGRSKKHVNIFVVNNLQVSLLGRPAIESLRLVSRVNTVADQRLLYMHADLFQGFGKTPGKYHIQLKEDAQCNTWNSR